MCTLTTLKSRNYHHGDLRKILLKTTREIIEEKGVERISIREIAHRTGVSPMALYRHFPDKEALLVAIAEQGFIELRDALKKADSHAPQGEALKAQAITYVTFASQHRSLFRLMFGPVTATNPRAEQEEGDNAYHVLARRIVKDVGGQDSEHLTIGYWALVHGLATLIIDNRIPNIGNQQIGNFAEKVIISMLPMKSRS